MYTDRENKLYLYFFCPKQPLMTTSDSENKKVCKGKKRDIQTRNFVKSIIKKFFYLLYPLSITWNKRGGKKPCLPPLMCLWLSSVKKYR